MNPAGRSVTAKRWTAIIAVLIAIKLWLVAAQPVVAIGPAAFDDRLFLNLAAHLLEGEWLGSYSQFTLMKGPMYPLFIAGTFWLGIPLPLAQHLLYLAACFLLVRALQPCLPAAGRFLLFVLLWWNPMTFEMPVLGRVLRQNLYTPATIAFFAGLIALTTRQSASRRVRVAWGALLGITGAALWLTREETVWIAPSTLLLTGAAAWLSWRARDRFRSLCAPVVTATLTGGAILVTVCGLNFHYYGWFGSVEFRAPEFQAAYGSLQRVTSTYQVRYVPVTREARQKIYAVSPAFAELRPYLEGDIGRSWANISSGWVGRPTSDMEMGGGWFMWALRDAVIAAGHNQSARAALDFYARLAGEVNRACDEGRLPASPRRDSMVPRWQRGHYTRLVRLAPDYAAYFVTFRGFSAYPPDSMGPASLLQLFRDLTRWPLAHSSEAPELDRPQQHRIDRWRLQLLQGLGSAMGWLAAGAFLAGLLAWGYSLVRLFRTRHCRYTFAIATAALGGAAAVFAVNLLVHVMSFPNLSPGSFAQGYPLLLLFAVVAVSDAIGGRRSVRD